MKKLYKKIATNTLNFMHHFKRHKVIKTMTNRNEMIKKLI